MSLIMRRSLIFQLSFFLCQVCAAQTVSTFDVLVVTRTLTVVGTTTLQGNAFSIGISSFVVSEGNVGFGTTTPVALIHAVGPAISGGGSQFKWISSSASLRVGEVSGAAWDPARIGIFSMAFGLNPEAIGAYSSITGGRSNTSASDHTFIGGGYQNNISSGLNDAGDYTVIGGGANNSSVYYAQLGFIGGGANHSLQDSYSGIVSGLTNTVTDPYNFIGGGISNTSGGNNAVIVGGSYNLLQSCDYCAIGGGGGNRSNGGVGGVIAGGGISSAMLTVGNSVAGISASVLGGNDNAATGDFSAALGGHSNTAAGAYSVAAGLKASAATKGSFVWADSQNIAVTAASVDEFRARAGGGFVFLSTPSAATIIVSSGSILISTSATAAKAVPNLYISSTNGNVGVGTSLPYAPLDVQGAAQFGPSASKSTFTASPGGATYALQLSSGITISNGGPVNLTSGGFIRFADGSISTTAASGTGSSGTMVQFVSSTTTGLITTTSQIPADDTMPQITEGYQILSATITPQSASNKLLIRALIMASHTSNGYKLVSALFQGSTANAIAAAVQNEGDAQRIQDVVLTHVMDAGTTSATNFSIRVGAQPAGTLTLHGEGGSRLYGGALESSLTITEITP